MPGNTVRTLTTSCRHRSIVVKHGQLGGVVFKATGTDVEDARSLFVPKLSVLPLRRHCCCLGMSRFGGILQGSTHSYDVVLVSICMCRPCAGAMLICSVSFQFCRMSTQEQVRRRHPPPSRTCQRDAHFCPFPNTEGGSHQLSCP